MRPDLSYDSLRFEAPVHLIGAGGVGMSALARILLARGCAVSGSDMKDSPGLAALAALGARVHVGHDAANVADAGTIVVSSAIREHNPELVAARSRGIPVLHRAQLLAALMLGRRPLLVSGTHGKSTTTSMIALILQASGADPTFVIGGDLNERGTNAHEGAGAWFVAEADESDASLLWFTSEIAVITNVEAEHLDHYADEAEIRDTFRTFISNISPDGHAVICSDDEGARAVAEGAHRKVVTYGLDSGMWRAERTPSSSGQRLQVAHEGRSAGELFLPTPGAHNARNALGAIAAATLAGATFDAAASALGTFGGVGRRFQVRGRERGVTVIDDYAHHPTEVSAALSAAREQAPARVIAVFQPHLYSRTQHFGAALGAALTAADIIIVTSIYGAREDPQPGVTSALVVDGATAARPGADITYVQKRSDIASSVAERAQAGDLVLTIGAGDVTMLGGEILQALRRDA